MASSSANQNNSVPLRVVAPNNQYLYPPPLAIYANVVASPQVFMDTLKKLHAAMGTKFRIPVIAGKELDLHRLFVEVTIRGGIEKVLEEKRMKEARYWTPSPDHALQQVSHVLPSPEIEAAMPPQPQIVSGFIDSKLESGYRVTVKIGSEDFKGVLYHVPMN
ncbi:hypothetical protein K7X08_002332 [Anisodus acutangulus]|uniref:ARID domain-containing protein n=1 Tax=Anisodus acutangulus TaxID=402998 RepID=A0A9Q1LRM2_9SOLA|nr:hypothetical protein K7X08_002332 [Anisodus acutangulus]